MGETRFRRTANGRALQELGISYALKRDSGDATGAEEDAIRIVTSAYPFIELIARQFLNGEAVRITTPHGPATLRGPKGKNTIEDLTQEGMLAVWRKLPEYDPGRDVTLSTYLHLHAAGRMVRAMYRDNGTIDIPYPIGERIARADPTLDMDDLNVIAARLALSGAHEELDAPLPGTDVPRISVWTDGSDPVEERYNRRIDARGLVRVLDPRERTIIEGIYRDELTNSEIGSSLTPAISGERVRQIAKDGIGKMRAVAMGPSASDGPQRS